MFFEDTEFEEIHAEAESDETLAEHEFSEDDERQLSFAMEEPEVPKLNYTESCSAIEAILFTMGQAVEISVLAQALDLTEKEVRNRLNSMQEDYLTPRCGIMLVYFEDKVQLCTKKEFYPFLIRIAATPRKQVLTEVMLETLSIIAYKQPVTKGDIERIRGVKSDFGVNKLLEYGLIEEVGRLDAPGRPVLFATSEEFLRRFGMSSTDKLPHMDEEQIETIKEEAEEEIEVKI